MAKFRLDEVEDESLGVVFGIVSEVPPAKLCYHLNQQLHLQLKRSETDLDIRIKDHHFYYPKFEAYDAFHDAQWFLVSNRNPYIDPEDMKRAGGGLFSDSVMSGAPLIKAHKAIDCFFWALGLDSSYFDHTFNLQLKRSPYVRALTTWDGNSEKGLQLLQNI